MSKEQAKQKLCQYWFSQIKRAGKQIPKDEWKEAKSRLEATEKDMNGKDKLPVVNGFRNHYESSRAYLDQKDPSFKVLPAPAYRLDPVAVKQAECEKTYLEAIWREQNFQLAETRKLNSALLRNVGYTMPGFDTKKWMPTLRYLPAERVRIDPDCQGIIENMKWWAYQDYMSFTEFSMRHKISKSELEKLKNRGEYSLDEEEIEHIAEEERDAYRVVTIWNIFAKNAAAVQDSEEDDKKKVNLKEETPTRFIKLVEGLSRPIQDSSWSFDLDINEHLLTALTFNKLPEGLYGFTDYKQMKRMDAMKDTVMSYIENDAYFSSIRKFLAGDSLPDDISLDDFMNKAHRSVLPGMLDEGGNPKLKEVMAGQPNSALVNQYELMENEAKKASGLSELLAEGMADLKEVTAIGVRAQEQKLHQRVNLRLGGPAGYEKSIQEDAVKLLEIAHQFVPRYSELEVKSQFPTVDAAGMPVIDESGEIVMQEETAIQSLEWADAQRAMMDGAKLLKLGIDAIVGPDLAQYWVTTDEVPLEEIRLSTKVSVVPGSTRSITQEQQATDMLEMFSNVLMPFIYQPMGRFDLAVHYLKQVGRLKGMDGMEDYLPTDDEIKQFEQQQAEMAQQQAAQESEADNRKAEQELENKAVSNELDLQIKREQADLEREKQEIKLQGQRLQQEMKNATVRV